MAKAPPKKTTTAPAKAPAAPAKGRSPKKSVKQKAIDAAKELANKKKADNAATRREKARQAARDPEEIYEERLAARESQTTVRKGRQPTVKKAGSAFTNKKKGPASQPPERRQPPRRPSPVEQDEDDNDDNDRYSDDDRSSQSPYKTQSEPDDRTDTEDDESMGEEESPLKPSKSNKRSRKVTVDDENHEDDDEEQQPHSPPARKKPRSKSPERPSKKTPASSADHEGQDNPREDEEPARKRSPKADRHSKKTPKGGSPKRKQRNSGNAARQGRVKAGHYKLLIRNTLKLAWGYYRTLLTTRNPFPSPELADKYARRAWRYARNYLGHPHLKADAELLGLITARGSQMRGELKNLARPLTRTYFHLIRRPSMIPQNLKRYRDFTHDFAYVYEDPRARLMRWCHPILFELVMEMWFARRSSEGVLFPELFDGVIPAPTIALVFTVVANCLEEWAKGSFQPIPFRQEDYEGVYTEILANLETLGEDNLQVFGTELWKDASDGFQMDIANKTGVITTLTEEQQDQARLDIQEWARRRGVDTGEDAAADA